MYANAYATTASQADMVDWGALRDQVEVEGGYQALLERDVVVRRLRPSAAASPRKRGRFIREIQTLAALHHHNFVRVYDAGLNDEVPFAVYERLQGITAQHRLELLQARGAAMELDEAVRIVRGVADGVEYARRRGVHVYDLTPPNITLTDDRRVVLTSLGQPLPDNPLTAPADVLAYTPPERLFGGVVEDDSEVYSLGVLLAHLIFGRLPFDGNAIAIIAQKQQSSSLPLLEDGRLPLGCPYPLATVMHRATSYEAGERYPSVEVFRMALLEALDDHPLKAQPLPSRAWRGEVVAALEWPQAGRPWPRRQGRAVSAVAQAAYAHADLADDVVMAPAARRAPAAARGAPVAGAAAPAPAPEAELVALEAEPEAAPYDPLMPGLNNPALHAALPFTVLVPLPEQAEEPAGVRHGAGVRQNFLSAHHMVILVVLTILAITTAVMFG